MAEDFAKKFYTSKAWRALRFRLILERGQKCERCGRIIADVSKLTGHHKMHLTPQNINATEITLNPDNIEIVCFDCHNAEHERYGYSAGHNVYIVYGSPLSGKTSFVNQVAKRGDMILDTDKIYQCISGLELYDKPNSLRFNVFAIRDKIIDMIKTRYGSWHDAFVVGGYPRREERQRLAAQLGAELVYMEASPEECLARADCRPDAGEWRRYIEKWWDAYTP